MCLLAQSLHIQAQIWPNLWINLIFVAPSHFPFNTEFNFVWCGFMVLWPKFPSKSLKLFCIWTLMKLFLHEFICSSAVINSSYKTLIWDFTMLCWKSGKCEEKKCNLLEPWGIIIIFRSRNERRTFLAFSCNSKESDSRTSDSSMKYLKLSH